MLFVGVMDPSMALPAVAIPAGTQLSHRRRPTRALSLWGLCGEVGPRNPVPNDLLFSYFLFFSLLFLREQPATGELDRDHAKRNSGRMQAIYENAI